MRSVPYMYTMPEGKLGFSQVLAILPEEGSCQTVEAVPVTRLISLYTWYNNTSTWPTCRLLWARNGSLNIGGKPYFSRTNAEREILLVTTPAIDENTNNSMVAISRCLFPYCEPRSFPWRCQVRLWLTENGEANNRKTDSQPCSSFPRTSRLSRGRTLC